MKIFNWLAEMRYRNAILYKVGMVHFILFFMLCLLYVIDSRQVLGINTWIKPMKFTLSIGIYVWTIGWILFDLRKSARLISILSWIIAVSMIIEISIILYQASRAVQSHFNFDTGFDAILFGVMGIMILINTGVIIVISMLFLFSSPPVDRVYLTSLRVGLMVFLVSSYIGKIMIDHSAHSINGTDGGAGLPFFNWSTEHGDLRIAHFMGLHALQIIPLFSYLMSKKMSLPVNKRMLWLAFFTVCYVGLFSFLYYQAAKGRPLWS